MPYQFKNPKAVLIRKMIVGAAFFLASCLVMNVLSSWKMIVFPGQYQLSIYILLGLIAAGTATFIVNPVDRVAKHVLRDYVMRREHYAHISLLDLVDELQSTLNLRELANLVVNSFAEAFHLQSAAFFVLRREVDSFDAISAYGWQTADLRKSRLSAHSLLADVMRQSGQHTLTRNGVIKSVRWQDATNLENDFNTVRAGWVLPFFFKNELLGFMAFGSNSTERFFEKSDFEFFLRFARKVSVCLRNAMETEVLVKRNDELQGEQSHRFQISKQKAVSLLAEGLGHEIHNPLAIISGKAQVLLFKKGVPDWEKRVEDALTVMIQQSNRAADIVRKVLNSVRESQAPARELDLKKAALEAAEFLRCQTAAKQITVTIDAEENLMFHASPGDMHEIFSGFILSGIEMLGSHGWIKIEMNRMRYDDAVEILVTDSGRGLDPNMLDQIFDPFFKTRHESLGLGLFAAKQIVHRYGGSLRAESRAGEGVVFQIQLPLEPILERVTMDLQIESKVPEAAPERK